MTELKRLISNNEPTAPGGDEAAPRTKRLNVNLPLDVFDELVALSKASGRTLTEIVRLGFGLADLAIKEEKKGHRLALVDDDDRVKKEVVLPR